MLRANVANCRNKPQLRSDRGINREIGLESPRCGAEDPRWKPGNAGVCCDQVVVPGSAPRIVAICRKCPRARDAHSKWRSHFISMARWRHEHAQRIPGQMRQAKTKSGEPGKAQPMSPSPMIGAGIAVVDL